MGTEKTYLEISWGTLWKILIFLAVLIILYYVRWTLAAFFMAIIIALGFEPFINFFEKRGIPRLLDTIIIFLFLILLFGTVIYFIFPLFSSEVTNFISRFSKIIFIIFNFKSPPEFITNLTSGFERILNFLTLNEVSLTETLSKIAPKILLGIATVIISFFLMVEKDGTERFLKAVLPENYERTALHIFHGFKIKIRRWFLTQLVMSSVIGIMTGLGLWLLGVNSSFLLGLLAAVFELVPIVGPVLVGSLAFLIALSDSFILGIYTALFFVFVQQFESHILIPLIFGKTINVHPVIVIVAIVGGSQVAGILGFVLAVPIAILIQETITYLAAKKAKRLSLEI